MVTLSTTLVLASLTHVNIRDNNLYLPSRIQAAARSALDLGIDLLLVVLWLSTVSILVLAKYGQALFA